MLKPRGFVPWGLPGPTRGRRRDAAALASKTKGTARMGGRVGVGPTDYTPLHPAQPSGRTWASKLTPGKHIISNIIFFMYGEVASLNLTDGFFAVLRDPSPPQGQGLHSSVLRAARHDVGKWVPLPWPRAERRLPGGRRRVLVKSGWTPTQDLECSDARGVNGSAQTDSSPIPQIQIHIED